jgi:uncharacterized protein (TIGR02246 family)
VTPLLSLLLWPAAGLAAEKTPPTPKPGIGGPSRDLIADEEIRTLYKNFAAAWNRHDTENMASFWTIDGDHVEPDGRHPKGREEVRKLLEQEHTTVFKNTQIKLTIDTVWFLTLDTALVDGSYELSGATDPAGKPIPVRKGHLTSMLLKENGRWWVAASRLMIPVPLVWREGE